MSRHIYSKAEDDFILGCKKSFPKEIVNRYNLLFNTNLNRSSLVNRYITLTKTDYNKKFMNFSRIEWIKRNIDNYKGTIFKIEELTFAFNKEFNLNITSTQLKNSLYHNGFLLGRSTKSPVNKKTIGFERKFDGEWYVKVSDEKSKENYHKFGYQKKTRYMYEKYHNIKLKDYEYIIQLDGNLDNFSKDNLFLVDKKIMPFMRHEWWGVNDPQLKKTMLLKCNLDYVLKKNKKIKTIGDFL